MDALTLAVVGISHHTAAVDVRERFAVDTATRARILAGVTESGPAREAVLLSTCNRTEFYLVVPEGTDPTTVALPPLADAAGYTLEEAKGFFYCRRGRDAAHHLLRVVSSLDSMVLGEAQIQGQVREAYETAAELPSEPRVVGPVLSRLFQSALAIGGRVRSETALGEGAASVPSAAVELARKIFGPLRGRRALVLGAGDMSELMLECLRGEGVKGLVIANRSQARAMELAARAGATAVGLQDLAEAIASVDMVATATSSPVPVLTREVLLRAMPAGPRRPLFIIDMAIPRDVDPGVGDVDNVFLYDIDDLQHIVHTNLERREAQIAAADGIIEQGIEDFWGWYASLDVVPMIRELREGAEAVRRAEVEKAMRRLQHLQPEDREVVEAMSRQLLNKMLHSPTVRLRDAAANGRGVGMLEAARYLFGLESRRRQEREAGEEADAG